MSVAFQWSRNKRSGKHFSHTHLGVWVPVCRGGECWVTWSVIVWFCLAWLIVVDEKSGFPLVLAHSHVSLAHKSLVCNLNLTCTLKSWLVMCRWSCNVSIINNFSSMSTMKIQLLPLNSQMLQKHACNQNNLLGYNQLKISNSLILVENDTTIHTCKRRDSCFEKENCHTFLPHQIYFV